MGSKWQSVVHSNSEIQSDMASRSLIRAQFYFLGVCLSGFGFYHLNSWFNPLNHLFSSIGIGPCLKLSKLLILLPAHSNMWEVLPSCTISIPLSTNQHVSISKSFLKLSRFSLTLIKMHSIIQKSQA